MNKQVITTRRVALGALTTFCLLFLLSAPAYAQVKWEILSSANTNVAPGEDFVYSVRVRNIGDTTVSSGSPTAFTVSVPDGLVLTNIESEGPLFCSGLSIEPGEVRCESTSEFPPTTGAVQFPSFFVYAKAEPFASGVLSARYSMTGGGESISAVDPTTVSSDTLPFGFDAFEVSFDDSAGRPSTRAGAHPSELGIRLDFNRHNSPIPLWPVEPLKGYVLDLPPGVLFNLGAAEYCTPEQLADTVSLFPPRPTPRCPVGSQIGTSTSISAFGREDELLADFFIPPGSLFNMAPPPGVFARFGSNTGGVLGMTDVYLRNGDDHGFSLKFWNAARALGQVSLMVDLWSDPGDPSHDLQRSCPGEEFPSVGGPTCGASTLNAAFLRNPTSCTPPEQGLVSSIRMVSWEHPDDFVHASSVTHFPPGYPASPNDPETPWGPEVGVDDCADVPVNGRISVRPTTDDARTGSGLSFGLSIPNAGMANQKGVASSDIKSVKLSLPEGVTINPARAEGLGVCTPAQYAAEDLVSPAGSGCPFASKIGTVSVDTPLLDEDLTGSVYVAQPNDPATAQPKAENPFDSLLAIYLVIENPDRGVIVKLAGKVEADRRTGQLTSIVSGIPEQPFDSFELRLFGGPRSPLVTPRSCGKFTAGAELIPWSDPSRRIGPTSSFTISDGAEGRPCPDGREAIEPNLQAGTAHSRAGSFSPFVAWLDGKGGDLSPTKLSFELPPGLGMRLAGIERCSEADLLATQADAGLDEISAPQCPAASRLGRVTAGFGIGPVQAHAPGWVFLAGPYRGSSTSLVTVIPAVIGPFDLGTVVQRSALVVDPRTAAIELNADDSAPMPTLLQGVALHVSDLRVRLDRRRFMLNPTSCEKKKVGATLGTSGPDLASAGDDSSVHLSNPFWASACPSLDFEPKLALELGGDTRRGAHPSIRAALRLPDKDANVKSLVVGLPRSLLLDRSRIGAVCSMREFRRRACPNKSIYGHAKAITKLLDRPLRGPVYLRESKSSTPGLVASLGGRFDVDLVGRINANGDGVRAAFGALPDVPIEKLVLEFNGGRDGLLVVGGDMCRHPKRAEARLGAHGGQGASLRPRLGCS